MSRHALIRRSVRAMRAGRPVPADCAELLVPALEGVLSGDGFRAGLGLSMDREVREIWAEYLTEAVELLGAPALSEAYREMCAAVPDLQPYIGDPAAEDSISEPWRLRLLYALRLGDLPSERTVRRLCQNRKLSKRSAVA